MEIALKKKISVQYDLTGE